MATSTPTCVKFHPTNAKVVASTAWDGVTTIHHHQYGSATLLTPAATSTHHNKMPVLSCRWNGDTLVTGGTDCAVNLLDVHTMQVTRLGEHAAPVNAVHTLGCAVVTCGWDGCLRVWDVRTGRQEMVKDMQGRAHASDLREKNMLLSISSTGDTKSRTGVVDLNTMQAVIPFEYSVLRMQTRCAAFFTTDDGWATASVEGRCNVNQLVNKDRSFTFKLHRRQKVVHPIHTIVFHPVSRGTFATGGGDGTLCFWDKDKRQLQSRVELDAPVLSLDFSHDGRWIAVATGEDFACGESGEDEGAVSLIQLKAQHIRNWKE